MEPENYIKIYEGDTIALGCQVKKLSIFYKKYIKIEGDKMSVFVDRDELNTLKMALKASKDILSATEKYEHYYLNFNALNNIDSFNGEKNCTENKNPTINELRKECGLETIQGGDVVLKVFTKE